MLRVLSAIKDVKWNPRDTIHLDGAQFMSDIYLKIVLRRRDVNSLSIHSWEMFRILRRVDEVSGADRERKKEVSWLKKCCLKISLRSLAWLGPVS